ncbi:efflux RND transporter permease subunit [Desulfotalea psychrophila]|uniref:Probable cation efflux system protein (CzcA) n=1 Tax=Desulfotalea psychrophila (strain LSv54 / DSM 12343) TaxID=177439 RepID=Q6ARC4_DESPS|nr:efflux RND transporter permease subunit [Desulfotalea psychrophila]CAG35100.1 probable cation efflux system protein (CzcA) [Desulfotalea psychrophila LSv54]
MIRSLISISIKNRVLVLLFTLIIVVAGLWSMLRIPLDAIPDLSDVQVIVFTDYVGQSPQVVEDQVTYPLTTAMLAVPYAKTVRGFSFFGMSFVYVIFADGTDLYWARSRVMEALNYVSGSLPANVTPTLGPDATGVGWVYQYVLQSDKHDLQQLRSIQDWFLRYELMSVPGVSEVASIGGFVKQYQVVVDPNKLRAYNISLRQVRRAIQRSNNDVGGRVIEMGETEFMVRGIGYIKSLEDIENIGLGVDSRGTPILIKNIAQVQIGPEIRRGVLDFNGEGETVGGIVVMRYGENALQVIERVKKRLEEIQPGLPAGVKIEAVYDRSNLILSAVKNLRTTLLEESLIVALVCLIFLAHLRSALVGIITLPIGIFISFILMERQGINANIMSLGGIAIAVGAMVDAAIVMIENVHKHMEHDDGRRSHWELVKDASLEVGPALFFSLLIIAVSFLPVFALEAQEGRLFKPLAYTKTYAMAGAAFLAVTLVPVLMGYMIRGKIMPEHKNPINRFLIWIYDPAIRWALGAKKTVVVIALLLMATVYIPYQRIGSEFMPPLDEGDLLYMPTTLPGISIAKARELVQQTDKIIKSFPEVATVAGKAGRVESATDPAPLSMLETTIVLKPKSQWREGMTTEKLVAEMDKAIQFPGVTNAWTMPITARIDMLSTGIKTPVGLKLMGNDLEVLADLGKEVEVILGEVPGTVSVYAERVTGGNYLDFNIDRQAAARYGLTVGDVQEAISGAIGGMNVATTVEGLQRYPINVRYARDLRDSPETLGEVLIATPGGAQIPMRQVATIVIKKGPAAIKSENARTNALVYVDIAGVDIGSYVQEARAAVAEGLSLPPGYSVVWSGQYEYMARAKAKMMMVVPATLLLIFLLLYLNFRTLGESLIVMLSVPFSLVGGLWLMDLLGYNMSVAVAVGFIALAGVATETGVVMLIYLDISYRQYREKFGERFSKAHLEQAIEEGAAQRVRPKIMTVVAIIAGLAPIMWSSGTGSEVMKRIATPMIGGMLSSTLLTLFILPVVYGWWRGRGLSDRAQVGGVEAKKDHLDQESS